MFKLIFAPVRKMNELILALLNRIKVFYLILVIVALMVFFLSIQGYMGLKTIDNMQAVTQQVFNSSIQSNENINYIRNTLSNLRISYLESLLNKSVDYIPFDSNTILNHVNILKTTDQNAAAQFEDEINGIKAILDQPITISNYNDLSKKLSLSRLYLENMEVAARKNTMLSMGFGNQFSADSKQNTIIILIISTILAVGVGLLVASSISRPLRAIVKATDSLAKGVLSQEIKANGCREAISVVNGLNHAITGLREVVGSITKTSELVRVAAQQINVGNQDLSERTQEQAATLEEIASTIEEVNISIEQVANNSVQANQKSQTTLDAVNEGEKTIQETFNSMAQISTSSKQIAEIIKVVNEIAFQTNLLALNASVEAARAGEHGRGFAVVATEIRNLSNKTSESAKRIDQLIKENMNHIQQGNLLAEKSVTVLQQIVTNTKQTAELIAQTSISMKEQSAASVQIQTSIEQLNQVTQENAAIVEEYSSSSQSLYHEAEKLRELIGQFTIE